MAEKRTTAQRLVDLEQKVDEQRLRIAHLEELHRMQAMPFFLDKFIVDYEGPKYRELVEGEEEVPCRLCHRPIWFGDLCYEIQSRRIEELLENTICTRSIFIHTDCFLRASREGGYYRFIDGEMRRE